MIIASRRKLLPRPERKIISPGWCLFWIGLFIAVMWSLPLIMGQPFGEIRTVLLFLVPAVTLFSWLTSRFYRAKLRRWAVERSGESICTFARSFDYRRIDTRIIRAVHEEVSHWIEGDCPGFPLRPEDRLETDLEIDWEDLEDMAKVIAFRTRRSLAEPEKNPFYGKVGTSATLVHFFAHQPLA
jgi:hypothetical protein